jgi:nucleoside-diphosphate-sugar epimerase
MTRILITGAAGRIGTQLTRQLANRYDLVLTDRIPIVDARGCTVIPGDIADIECVRQMVQGIDVVIHLAANPDEYADWDRLLQPNIIGLYNIFAAADAAKCRRVIFASSIHAVMGYPADVQVCTTMPVRPLDLYGATKAWGEAVARYYADQRGLSAICLRLGWVLDRDDPAIQINRDTLWPRHDGDHLDMMLTYDDLVRLVEASIEAPESLRFGIFHGISDNRWKRLDISDACAVLGYRPQDDAFAIAASRLSHEVLV